MVVVDNAIYVGGVRTAAPDLGHTRALLRQLGGFAWVELDRPTADEVSVTARELGVPALATETAHKPRQRPALVREDEILFAVLRPARYLEDVEKVEFGELHVCTGPGFVVTVQHAQCPDLGRLRRRLEDAPQTLRLGPEAVLCAVLAEVVDQYGPVVAGLENDIDEIEDQLFSSAPTVSRRIYELSREVMAFQRATSPLVAMFDDLGQTFDGREVDAELRRRLQGALHHTLHVVERADAFRPLLQNALTVHGALVVQQQNEEMRRVTEASYRQSEQVKRISSWAAILFAPTLIGTIYGMNFRHMPELHWAYGYPLALLAMGALGVLLYAVFKRHRWL